MKSFLAGLSLFVASSACAIAAESVQQCMVHAKILQNPCALAGAAAVCMQSYFDELTAEANACRDEAALKALPGPEYAACQAALILGLRDQVEICREEADGLSDRDDLLAARVGAGAANGCNALVEEAKAICRDNAAKFSSNLAQTAADAACDAAGL